MFLYGFRAVYERCFGNRLLYICIYIKCYCSMHYCCCTSLLSLFFDSMDCRHVVVASILVMFLFRLVDFLNGYLCDWIPIFHCLGYLCSHNSDLTMIGCAALLTNSFLVTFVYSFCDSDGTQTICQSFSLPDSNELLSVGGWKWTCERDSNLFFLIIFYFFAWFWQLTPFQFSIFQFFLVWFDLIWFVLKLIECKKWK